MALAGKQRPAIPTSADGLHPGTGALSTRASVRPPDHGSPSSVFTISRVAGMLGETEERLQELASEMEPEDGCLIVWGTGDQSITAFTREGVEYLEQLI